MLRSGSDVVVVDPGDDEPVRRALDAGGLVLRGILVTHHHPDHVGGIDALRARLQGPVWGPASERIPGPFTPVRDGDSFAVLDTRVSVIEVPGHTAGHVAYVAGADSASPALFCGDTLFSGGCGRLFEGTAAQMQHSLGKLASLPGSTRVYCAHEYTLGNLRFALAVEPGNEHVRRALQRCEQLRADGKSTLPSSVDEERRINPFLRCTERDVIATALRQGAADDSPLAVFAALRQWKNSFR